MRAERSLEIHEINDLELPRKRFASGEGDSDLDFRPTKRFASDEGEKEDQEAIERLGCDIIQWCIMVLLDAHSLARCRMVSRAWKSMAEGDLLWLPLCCKLFTMRAQLPLQLLNLTEPIRAFKAYSMVMTDARKRKLVPKEMCARTWEIGVKPSCGPYWYSLDPTTRGEPGLVRFFDCDGSLTAGPGDPIWGGQESCWTFVFSEGSADQYVKINYWPMFNVLRLNDGRWRLENKWATYTTQPDLYIGTGNSICKESAPPCTECLCPRLMNAVSKVVPVSRENVLVEILRRMSRSVGLRLLDSVAAN